MLFQVQVDIATSCNPRWNILKVYLRSSKRKSKSLPWLLPRYVALALGVTFCAQALAGQSNVAYFAGGCFWCTEAVFQQAPGVTSVVSGYMRNAETVQITFDSTRTTYDKLLVLFWHAHNPTGSFSRGACPEGTYVAA
jgi:hypothetical protein